MSAVDRAHEMRGPVETFGGFAHLEIAAIDDERRLATLLAICDEALEESQALLAARPDAPGAPTASPPRAPGLLAGLLRAAGGGSIARIACGVRRLEQRQAPFQHAELERHAHARDFAVGGNLDALARR